MAANILSASSDTPRLDAELLLAHALGVERDALLLDPARYTVPNTFAGLIARRLNHEPVAYIIGYQDFWTIRLEVGPGVLIPRSDSETLIEAAVEHFSETGPGRVLDLGTGPGTLLLAALAQWPDAEGLGIDTSPVAIDYATDNAERLGMTARARFQLSGWAGAAWPDGTAADLVLCNPPYVATNELLMRDVLDHEPHEALFAGGDGLDDYRMLLPVLAPQIVEGGIAIIEIGHRQREAVTRLAEGEGFIVDCRRDLGGRDRTLLLQRP